jgi:large subunit ribosomal protein L32
MAVQKSKVTPARRGMRRSHDSLKAAALTEDVTTGEIDRRDHIAADGYYRGKKVLNLKD